MRVSRLRRTLYRLVREFVFLATALLSPAILLPWLMDLIDVAAQNTPYPRLWDGVIVEWK
jgi:hypothetical protein